MLSRVKKLELSERTHSLKKNDVINRQILFQSPMPARLKKSAKTKDEQFAVVGNRYKLISVDNGKTFQLYDLIIDKAETIDVSYLHKDLVDKMKGNLSDWQESCLASSKGEDYKAIDTDEK